MPFTLAHPAAVLPLRRRFGRWNVFSALVVGSMTPDFAYFVPFGPTRAASHSLAGLFTFCLPIGIVTYVVAHACVAPLAYALAPRVARVRFRASWREGRLPAASPLAVAFSLLVGSATHIAWDSFTHGTGAMVAVVPFLRAPLFEWRGHTAYVYDALQHASTLAGLAILARWAMRLPMTADARGAAGAGVPSARARAWLIACLLVPPIAVGVAFGARHAGFDVGVLTGLRRIAWHAVTSAGGAALATATMVGLAWRSFRPRATRSSS